MQKTLVALIISLLAQTAFSRAPYPIVVRGADEASFQPIPPSQFQADPKSYDAIIIGGGLAGLSAAVFLSDPKLNVLLIEKESQLGGLAAGETIGGNARVGRGAAYWTSAYEEEQKILEHIGLGDFETKFAIPEPIDSYLWKGVLYEGIWEEETLEKLPTSFAVFKRELKLSEKRIPNQPMEEAKDLEFDKYSAAEWVRKMPSWLARRKDPESVALYQKYLADSRLNKNDPMKDVIDFLELYCRSALGATPDKVSALAFANFYISEIETRYTSDQGTGKAADKMVEMLQKTPNVKMLVNSTAVKIRSLSDSAEVDYITGGKGFRAKAKYVVFAAQLKLAPKLIENFTEKAPEQTEILKKMDYAHYSVHVVSVKGHPYRATYDTWTRAQNYTPADFTDVILGRWMDPDINAYEGLRDFKHDPKDDRGVMTIYHPLEPKWLGQGYTEAQAKDLAHKAIDRMVELYTPLLKENWGTKIEIQKAETNRWPYSVHVAKPGHFIREAKILRRPFGRIFFANNNLGTPAFEEALFRGHCASNNILLKLDPQFKQEAWTKCPVDSTR